MLLGFEFPPRDLVGVNDPINSHLVITGNSNPDRWLDKGVLWEMYNHLDPLTARLYNGNFLSPNCFNLGDILQTKETSSLIMCYLNL